MWSILHPCGIRVNLWCIHRSLVIMYIGHDSLDPCTSFIFSHSTLHPHQHARENGCLLLKHFLLSGKIDGPMSLISLFIFFVSHSPFHRSNRWSYDPSQEWLLTTHTQSTITRWVLAHVSRGFSATLKLQLMKLSECGWGYFCYATFSPSLHKMHWW